MWLELRAGTSQFDRGAEEGERPPTEDSVCIHPFSHAMASLETVRNIQGLGRISNQVEAGPAGS